jgi:hypothetical protein
MVVVLEPPQACKARIAESQPGNTTSPACVQVGSVDSAQRRNASSSDAQDVTDSALAQPASQSVLRAENAHPARATFSQVAEQDAESCAEEQLLPQVASDPASACCPLTVPPHPTAAQSPAHTATHRMSSSLGATLSTVA